MERIASKTIRVMGPALGETEDPRAYDAQNEQILNDVNWAAVEDAVNDQLPIGYYAKVED